MRVSLEVSALPPLGVSGRPYRQQGLEQPGRMNRAWDWNGWEEKREREAIALCSHGHFRIHPRLTLSSSCIPMLLNVFPSTSMVCMSFSSFFCDCTSRIQCKHMHSKMSGKHSNRRENVAIIHSKIACLMENKSIFSIVIALFLGIWHSAWQP